MDRPIILSEGQNHTAIDLGNLENLMDYSYLHPKLKTEIRGKIFTGEILQTTGAEISFQILPPSAQIPFFHQHRKHEEIYIFLKGKGEFQVDEKIFEIREGSIVRVSPDGKRTWRNYSEGPLVFICIQTQQGSLDSHFVADGFATNGKVEWN